MQMNVLSSQGRTSSDPQRGHCPFQAFFYFLLAIAGTDAMAMIIIESIILLTFLKLSVFIVLLYVLFTIFVPDSGIKVVLLGYLPKGLFLFLPWGFPVCHGKPQRYLFLPPIFVPATSPSSSWHPVGVFDTFSSAKVACPDDPASTDELFQKKSLMAAFHFWRCRLPSVIYTAKSGIPCLFPRNSLPWSSAWATHSPAQEKPIPDRMCR